MANEEFKGNSNASKELNSSKVVTTNVTVRSANAEKPRKRFFAEDAKTVGGHVVNSVIIPSLQKLVSDGVKSAIDWLIYGSKGAQPRSGAGMISYSRYYQAQQGLPSYGQPSYISPQPQRSNIYAVNDVTFNDRGKAEEVLQIMKEAIERYGSVSVATFYELIGQRCSFTDNTYGWLDLSSCDVVRDGSGFYIRFPRVQPLEVR